MSSKGKTKHRSKRKENRIETTNLPPVQDAVREYRVIEDSAYAYHLQEAEIEDHYAQNINLRRLVQDDIRKAKELQDEEDRKARILTIDEEQDIKQMDEELAEFIQEEIFKKNVQEDQEKKEREERDKELALLMEEKERRQVARSKMHEDSDLQLAERLQNVEVTPPGSRDEQRMRLMSDEELARRLQEEEKHKIERTKLRKKEMKSVVEMQDEELAKYIHDREVEAAEWKLRKEHGKKKSKKKGKWDNEPLYYDDNINPPDFRQLHGKPHAEDPRRLPSNGYQQTPPSYDRQHRPREDHHHQKQQRREEPRHRHKDEKRPDRPPPPKFSESHNTEVKVPLDASQRHSDDRHSSRTSDAQEHGRDYERSSSHRHEHRSHSERNKNSRSSNDHADMPEHPRSSSERHRVRQEQRQDHWKPREHEPHPKDKARDRRKQEQRSSHDNRNQPRQEAKHRHENGRPTPAPRGSRSEPRSTPDPETNIDDEENLKYSDNFTRLTEEEVWNQNNNVKTKGSKKKEKKNGDCKQQ